MKRIICLVMSLVLVMSLMTSFSITAVAEDGALFSQTEEVQVGSKAAVNWPYQNFNLSNATTVKAGSTFECDLRVDDIEAIKTIESAGNNLKFYVKAYAGSTVCKSITIIIKSSDFDENNTIHINAEFLNEMTGVTKLLVQGYGNGCESNLYVSNIKYTQPVSKPVISLSQSSVIAYGKTITASVTVDNVSADGCSYQWYLNTAAISGATSSTYTPVMSDIGGWIYCVATKDNTTLTSDELRIVASDSILKTTEIKLGSNIFSESYGNYVAFLTNTKLYAGSFDSSLLAGGGYFRVEYTGGTAIPMFNFNTWSSTTGKSTVSITATRSGENSNGTKWAEYSYEDCIHAWGDNDFSELKAIRVVYPGDDYSSVTLTKVTWTGYPTSYGELGEVVNCSMSSTATTGRLTWIYTKHVGGDFDTSQLRKDGYFYIEYSGNYEDALYITASSYSDAKNTWVNITASETGKTANGYYSIFTVADIEKSFGSAFRNFDQIRLMVSDGKSVTAKSATIYYFAGSGALVDDISIDGYNGVLEVPWEMYNETDKNGIAVIGASIQQNPMVTASALEGAPYYSAYGDWNAVLGRTDCVNYGIGGETSTHIQRRFDEILRYDFNTIIMQCGTNDLGVSTDNSVVAATVSGNYMLMFEKAKAYIEEGKELHIYVIPVLPSTAPKNREKIETVDAAIAAVCEKYDFVTYMSELYDQFLAIEIDDTTYVNTDLVFDSIHPNAAGYAVIAEAINSRLRRTNDSDSTLSELSYRLNDISAKVMVPEFETGSSGSTYDVLLPAGTANNASFSIYAVPSDNSATVTVPTTVTLKDGTATATVTVESADGSTTNAYTVNFAISKYIYDDKTEYSQNVDLVDGNSWPYVQYTVNYSGTVYAGAKIEFDVILDNEYAGKLYNEIDFAWVNYESKTIEYSEFEDGKLHVTYTVNEDITSGISAIQIKFGNGGECSYSGTITVSNLTVANVKNPNEVDNPDDTEDNAGFPASGSFTGYICVDDNYHMQIGTGSNEGIILTSNHAYDANSTCVCGHTIVADEEHIEEIIINEPVESIAEELDE